MQPPYRPAHSPNGLHGWPDTSATIQHIWESLGELRAGQVLNRKTAMERTEALERHLDARIDSLEATLTDRMDRHEDRIQAVEARPSPISTPLPAKPWYRDMTLKEMVGWAIAATLAITLLRQPELAERFIAAFLK